MFLFATIETMQESLKNATESNARDTTLVVYRENRFCPSTSRLPEYYKDEIVKIDGVESVIPVQIVVNNCGTSLDVVAGGFQQIKSIAFRRISTFYKVRLKSGFCEMMVPLLELTLLVEGGLT